MGVPLRFLTKNKYKAAEFAALFRGSKYTIIQASAAIEELQTEDMKALVEDKVIKAFGTIRRPVFVDHTGLYLDLLGGFPAGLTEIFWERLRNERLSQLVGRSAIPSVTAVTLIGYCDGRIVKTFHGELKGVIAEEPRGPEGFQWDPVFVPKGETRTFAEMGADKNKISMRREAIDAFITYLDSRS